eukprot:6942565-Pyramimonas_sp.AAC.1
MWFTHILGANMGPYSVKQYTGDTCHPNNRVSNTNCFTRILGDNMGPYNMKNHAGDKCHPEDRVGEKT